jgi:hypothetical protein
MRWPRGQRFSLSARGAETAEAYRATVQQARAMGRGALEAAERSWAAPHGLLPGDGVVLAEFAPGRRAIAEVARSLEGCGATADEVRAAVERLVAAGMIEPLPPGPEPRLSQGDT